jgi:DNA-binding NarL/FixJ family response regulator
VTTHLSQRLTRHDRGWDGRPRRDVTSHRAFVPRDAPLTTPLRGCRAGRAHHVGYGLAMDAGRSTVAATQRLLLSAATAAEGHRAALRDEAGLLTERDQAIVRAIRAGARLDEVAEAASVSRAAVSKAARRTLPSRSGRGGPYSRRRGSAAAVEDVAAAAQRLAIVRAQAEDTKRMRDRAIATVVSRGAGVSETARAVGLTPASVSVIARSAVERPGHNLSGGAVASAMK